MAYPRAVLLPPLIVTVLGGAACALPTVRMDPLTPAAPANARLSELWSEPPDGRDLLHGPGGADRAPTTNGPYTVLRRDESGFSPGYEVIGPDGRRWDVKVGDEVQSEIVTSRLLWALGYHQPPTYYLTGWALGGGDFPFEGQPARFRLETDYEPEGDWAWTDNPFVGTRALQGLLVVNLLLNNWDFKTSNNRIYRMRDPKAEPTRRFVVQDVGATLGKSRPLFHGTRNDIDDFEQMRLVRDARDGQVVLDYRGRHRDALANISVADVIWACERMNRLSDDELDAAFRAADYAPDIRRRFIAHLREKVQEGLALRSLVAPQQADGR